MLIGHIYFLEVLSQPNKTIANPSTRPINIPTFTLFIRIPTISPRTIAKIKAISPLRMLGWFSFFILKSQAEKRSAILKTLRTSPHREDDLREAFLLIQCNNICQ